MLTSLSEFIAISYASITSSTLSTDTADDVTVPGPRTPFSGLGSFTTNVRVYEYYIKAYVYMYNESICVYIYISYRLLSVMAVPILVS